MNQKKFMRAMCLFLVLIMLGGALVGALSTFASAADVEDKIIVSKTGLASAGQPEITFYDIDNEVIGTFSNSSNSDLVAFDSAMVVYMDETGETVEKNYSRADVRLFLYDKALPYKSMSQITKNSFYVQYNMGSSRGSAFANKISLHDGKTNHVYFDVLLENVTFRDTNKMQIITNYQTTTVKNGKRLLKTSTSSGTITISKAKPDGMILTAKTPKKTTTTSDKDGNYGPQTNYTNASDKDTTTDDSPNVGQSSPGTSNISVATPYLVIESYSTGQETQVAAGNTFPLDVTCKNTSTDLNLENVVMKVTTSEGLQLTDSTNIFYIRSLGKSGNFSKSLNVSVLPNAEAKSHTIDIAFTFEYILNGSRQKGDMTQQVSIPTVQQDRFSADPVEDLMEGAVGEEMYITGKYVNKSRGGIYNLSAVIEGNFPGSGKIKHVGNVAAGVSGEVEFDFTPDTPGEMKGQITYTYEDTMGHSRSYNIPFQTNIVEAAQDNGGMSGNMDPMAGVELDENGMPIDPNAKEVGLSFFERIQNPNGWELWAVVGGGVLLVVIITVAIIRKKKAAAEFEDDDETK